MTSDGAIEIVPTGPLRGRVAAPPSKSLTNRALVAAALADGESVIEDPLHSEDTEAMVRCLRAMGVAIEQTTEGFRVHGTGGAIVAPSEPADAGASGTTLRFLTAVAALAPTQVRFTGEPALMARPMNALHEALTALGPGHGVLDGGEVTVDAAASSQFVTAVLLVAPYARRDVTVRVRNLGAAGFVDLTLDLMAHWGVDAEPAGEDAWHIAAGQRYRPMRYRVEYDASAAAHLFALAMATAGEVTVTGVRPGTRQPDALITDVFERMGGIVERRGPDVAVAGPHEMRPIDVVLATMPDQLPAVAALAALTRGRSRIAGVEVARGHETDRVAALASQLTLLGAKVVEEPGALLIDGGDLRGARLDPHRDHRLAMAFASIGARVYGVTVTDPACVAKTYPGFWDDAATLGMRTRERA